MLPSPWLSVTYRLPVELPVAPLPIVSASSRTTARPCSASSSASVTPVMPPPTTSTSHRVSPCSSANPVSGALARHTEVVSMAFLPGKKSPC